MYQFSPARAVVAGSLFAGTVGAVLIGDEKVLPTLAVALLLVLAFAPPLRSTAAPDRPRRHPADVAIAVFTGFFGLLSLLISLFLPAVATALDLTGMYEGDFVRVTINDSHEFAYTACLLLLLRTALGAGYRIRARRSVRVGGAA